MDKTLETAANLATQLFSSAESVVNKYGPTVVDTVLWITRIEAMNKLAIGFIALAVLIFLVKKGKQLHAWVKDKDNNLEVEDAMPGIVVVIAFGGLGAIASFIVACIMLLNIWNYVGIVKPEIYLAKKAVDKALEVVK